LFFWGEANVFGGGGGELVEGLARFSSSENSCFRLEEMEGECVGDSDCFSWVCEDDICLMSGIWGSGKAYSGEKLGVKGLPQLLAAMVWRIVCQVLHSTWYI
jgi:hypothetical protein